MRKDEYEALEVGDTIEGGPLLPGVNDDPLMFTVVSTTGTGAKKRLELAVFWMDIQVGEINARLDKGEVKFGELA